MGGGWSRINSFSYFHCNFLGRWADSLCETSRRSAPCVCVENTRLDRNTRVWEEGGKFLRVWSREKKKGKQGVVAGVTAGKRATVSSCKAECNVQSWTLIDEKDPHSLAPWPDDWLAGFEDVCILLPQNCSFSCRRTGFKHSNCKIWTVTRPFGRPSGTVFTSETADGESWDGAVTKSALFRLRPGGQSGTVPVCCNSAAQKYGWRIPNRRLVACLVRFVAFCWLILNLHVSCVGRQQRNTCSSFCFSFTVMIP